MNYLAHMLLSGENPDVLVGNFMGDAIKGDPAKQCSPAVAEGVRLHRWIDAYADNHPIAREARAALRPVMNRFSAVGVDLLYDHFLSKQFDALGSGESIHVFAKRVAGELERRAAEMPLRSQHFLNAMIRYNWLVAYGTRTGMMEVCAAMDERLQRRLGVNAPLHQLFVAADAADYTGLEEGFVEFWKEIVALRFRHETEPIVPLESAWN